MQIFQFILAFYILTLSLVPCSDGDIHVETKKTTIEAFASDASEDHPHSEESHTEYCTPFCTCDCCISPITLFGFACELNLPDSDIHIDQVIYIQPRMPLLYHPIWQPPKV